VGGGGADASLSDQSTRGSNGRIAGGPTVTALLLKRPRGDHAVTNVLLDPTLVVRESSLALRP
jgi:hypothetical protein